MSKIWQVAGLAMVLIAVACSDREVCHRTDSMTEYADYLSLIEEDSCVTAMLTNPWKPDRILRSYVLTNDAETEFSLQSEENVVHTPLCRVVVTTNSHARLLSELGLTDFIAGVCEEEYITDSLVRDRLDRGLIADCGNGMYPNIERIISLCPDAIFVSPFEEAGYGPLEMTGIPLIECADYMETSPLGRAEWMRFYGRLFNAGDKADSLFGQICDKYNNIREETLTYNYRPSVMLDTKGSSAWYVAGGNSTIAKMIEDAGGKYLFSNNNKSGSVPLAFESVLERAADADIWLLKNSSARELTYENLAGDFQAYTRFKPFTTRNIWVCDVYGTPYFEMTAFHPELLLEELQQIFHQDTDDRSTIFYKRMK